MMTFDSFTSAQSFFLWAVFAIALLMGAIVNKTNFCTMGAVSDWVNMGDTGRFRAWLFAIAVALLGVTVLEAGGLVDVSAAFPPYRGASADLGGKPARRSAVRYRHDTGQWLRQQVSDPHRRRQSQVDHGVCHHRGDRLLHDQPLSGFRQDAVHGAVL